MDYTLRIRKRRQSEWFVLFILAMPFSFGTVIDIMGVPSAIKYMIDLVWILLLVTIAINRFKMPNRESKTLFYWIFAFFIVTIIGFVLNTQSPLYYLWGFRNNFRFFIFFIACIKFLDFRNAESYLKAFDILYYVNFFVTLVQFFVFGLEQDYLGGIFGTHEGSNGSTLIFLSIVVATVVLNYLNHKTQLYQVIMKSGIALLIAAMAELKFFYLVFLVIVFAATVITNFSIKKLIVVALSVFGVIGGINILVRIFPSWEKWFNLESMLASALASNGYTGSGDMNRLTSIPIAWEMFLTTLPKRLFGLGLGNCDTSAFAFLNTAFFERYGYLHYNWFSMSFMFMETGIIGMICYLLFFVILYLLAGKREKTHAGRVVCCQLAKVMVVVSLILIVYNQSLRTEAGYMMYFVLALPFVKDEVNNGQIEI